MKAIFYEMLTRATKILGPCFFLLVAKTIATGYFIFSNERRRISRQFYAVVFPKQNRARQLYCVWKQFLNFTHIYLDRFIQREVKDIDYTIKGGRYIGSTLTQKKGGILLMSHMGNWEIAAHLLSKITPDIKLLLYMGIRDKEEIESIQKKSIRKDGIQIISVDEEGGNPFDIVEGIRFLKNGGFVSMAGDVVWRQDQRTISGTFLGQPTQIPEAPFVLSLVSGAPLIVFFAFRTKEGAYQFIALPPIHVTAPTRDQRRAAIASAAQQYLQHLETALHQHPFEWYHFDRFIDTSPE